MGSGKTGRTSIGSGRAPRGKLTKYAVIESLEEWEQQPEETEGAYEAFKEYRDQGPRRALRKCPNFNKRYQIWSAEFRWVARAYQWDVFVERESVHARMEDLRKMNKQHAAMANLLLGKALERLQSLPTNELKPSDLSKFVELGVKIERLARGAETEHIKQEHVGKDGEQLRIPVSLDLRNVSDKDLNAIEAIAQRIGFASSQTGEEA